MFVSMTTELLAIWPPRAEMQCLAGVQTGQKDPRSKSQHQPSPVDGGKSTLIPRAPAVDGLESACAIESTRGSVIEAPSSRHSGLSVNPPTS